MPSVEPDAQVQWFSRVPLEAPAEEIIDDVEVIWDDENDTAPTLILERKGRRRKIWSSE